MNRLWILLPVNKGRPLPLPVRPIPKCHLNVYKPEFQQQCAAGVCIYCTIILVTFLVCNLFLHILLGVNVSISTSTIDVGVQCDIMLLPLLTSTPSHDHGSEEGDGISLPHDQTDNVDYISESWGEVTEEPREADHEECSEIENGALNQSTT